MSISPTLLSGVNIVELTSLEDSRGKFSRLFCAEELHSVFGSRKIVQTNHSMNTFAGTIRGLHYQLPPYAEMKLVRCIKGRVWDVALDLRSDSTTYLQWHAEELSAENSKMIIIPEGCAHGFQILDANSELLYFHTEAYQPSYESGIRYDDPSLTIEWPLKATHISERDRKHPLLTSSFEAIQL
jgi:dTDP-4-dehydrorhamnose 3,5-epimerase